MIEKKIKMRSYALLFPFEPKGLSIDTEMVIKNTKYSRVTINSN